MPYQQTVVLTTRLTTLQCLSTYRRYNDRGYDERLLTISPTCDETKLNADQNFEFLTYILGLYNKSWSNVACLIGDKCSTNKSVSNRAGVPFQGCASHRFNLAMRDILSTEKVNLPKIKEIMKKLRGLVLAAKLRNLTYLRAQVSNVTR